MFSFFRPWNRPDERDRYRLYLMSQLPENTEQYENSYLFYKNEYEQVLYYVNHDGEMEQVQLNDFNQFEEKLDKIKKDKDSTSVIFSALQLPELISLNGGPSRHDRFGNSFKKFCQSNLDLTNILDPDDSEEFNQFFSVSL